MASPATSIWRRAPLAAKESTMDSSPCFDLIEPAHGESAVVVEVPHAGLWMDPEAMAHTVVPVRAVARDADLYADELASEAPAHGATLLVARASRYVVDLNRGAEDYDGLSVQDGVGVGFPRGVVWRLSADGVAVLGAPLPRSELTRRLGLYYEPYHEALDRVVERKRRRFGGAVVLSLHTMPSTGHSVVTGQAVARADVVIGTRGGTTSSPALAALVEEHAQAFGWTVAHDDPYRGGATTGKMGRPREGIHAIQVELARRLYMSEASLARKDAAFPVVRSFCGGLVARIGAAALG